MEYRILTEPNRERLRSLSFLAGELGILMTHPALARVIRTQGIASCIPGASGTYQITDNVGTLDHGGKLTLEVLERIEQVLDNHSGRVHRMHW